MLNAEQFQQAISQGIITQAQYEKLQNLADSQVPARDLAGNLVDDAPLDFSVGTHDEPFRLFKGFRDFFIALGIVILGVGASSFLGDVFGDVVGSKLNLDYSMVERWATLAYIGLLIVLAIVLSEWVTARLRLPLSSLILTLIFAVWAGFFCGVLLQTIYLMISSAGIVILTEDSIFTFTLVTMLVGSVISLIAYYYRYRLPFVLLPLSGVAVASIWFLAEAVFAPSEFFTRIIVGVCGVAVFIVAMNYDFKDPERKTRLSECAFWLHLVAAPMIVHSVLSSSNNGTLSGGIVIGVIAILAIIALIVDRRAMLVSSLIYLGYLLYSLVQSSALFGGLGSSISWVIVGVFVLGLGLAWNAIRRFVVLALVPSSLQLKLPPTTN